MDRFQSLQLVARFLMDHEHLLEEAATFLAKAYVVYRVRNDWGNRGVVVT